MHAQKKHKKQKNQLLEVICEVGSDEHTGARQLNQLKITVGAIRGERPKKVSHIIGTKSNSVWPEFREPEKE